MQLSYVCAQWVALSLFLCLFSTVLSARSPAYVNDTADGNNDGLSWENAFTDLQSALDNTASGDIWVAAGTYKPSAYPATDPCHLLSMQLYWAYQEHYLCVDYFGKTLSFHHSFVQLVSVSSCDCHTNRIQPHLTKDSDQ